MDDSSRRCNAFNVSIAATRSFTLASGPSKTFSGSTPASIASRVATATVSDPGWSTLNSILRSQIEHIVLIPLQASDQRHEPQGVTMLNQKSKLSSQETNSPSFCVLPVIFALPAIICFCMVVTPISTSLRSVRDMVTDASAVSEVLPFE